MRADIRCGRKADRQVLLCKFEKKENQATLYESWNADPKSQDDRTESLLKIEYKNAKCASSKAQRSAFLSAFPKGSLTLEAAFVLPLFLMFFCAVFSLFSIMAIQVRLQDVLNDVAGELSAYYYAADKLAGTDSPEKQAEVREIAADTAGFLISEALVKQRVLEQIPELSSHPLMRRGAEGLAFIGSGFDEEHSAVRICTTYSVSIPYISEKAVHLTLSQAAVRRAWTGKEQNGDSAEKIVYVTERGSVYHTSLACTHLKLSVEAVARSLVERRRNEDGGKYNACGLCNDRPKGEVVYITAYGESYHYDRSCSGLKRTVKSVPLSQVGDKNECSRCKNRGKGGD